MPKLNSVLHPTSAVEVRTVLLVVCMCSFSFLLHSVVARGFISVHLIFRAAALGCFTDALPVTCNVGRFHTLVLPGMVVIFLVMAVFVIVMSLPLLLLLFLFPVFSFVSSRT